MLFIKKSTIIFLFLLSSVQLFSQQGYKWAIEAGGKELDAGRRMAIDANGNYFVIGVFEGCVTFGGTTTISSNNLSRDIFIASYTCNGALRWVNTIGSTANDLHAYGTLGIDVGPEGHVFATGSFTGTATFTSTIGGNVNRTSNGGMDIFVIKYTNAGQRLWDAEYGSTQDDFGSDIKYRTNDHLVITGGFTGTVNFGGTGFTRASAGNLDAFLLHMDLDALTLFARGMGSDGQDVGLDIEVTGNDAVFVSGNYGFGSTGNMTFQTTPTAINLTSTDNDWDAFLTRYDPATGNFLWARGINGTNNENGDAMTASNTRVYLVGNFNISTVIGATTHNSAGGYDMFVADFDHAGNLQNSQRYGGTGNDVVYGAGINGSLFAVGIYTGTANFSGLTNTSAGGNDIFVARINTTTLAADHLSTLGAAGNDGATGIIIPNTCEYQITGSFLNNLTVGASQIQSYGNADILIASHNLCNFSISLSTDCIGSSPTLSVGAARSGYTGQWYRDGIAIAGATGTTLVVYRSGNYSFSWSNCQTTDIAALFVRVRRCCPVGQELVAPGTKQPETYNYWDGAGSGVQQPEVKEAATVMTLRPNPVNDVLQVEVNTPISPANTYVEIYSTDGKPVSKINVTATDNTANLSINVATLAQGVYYISLITNNEVKATEKFVIQRD